MGRTDYEIVTDGTTVWVNSPEVCIGRFGPRGVDVHRTAEDQLAGNGQCLDCRIDPDWERFVSSMKAHHGICIEDAFRPIWTQNPHNTHPENPCPI